MQSNPHALAEHLCANHQESALYCFLIFLIKFFRLYSEFSRTVKSFRFVAHLFFDAESLPLLAHHSNEKKL